MCSSIGYRDASLYAMQVQLHARVNEGSITVDAARLVKELEESYARKVRTVGATALSQCVLSTQSR